MSKLLVLPGTGAVMAYRGQRHMLQHVLTPCLFGREPESFDALVEQLPEFIRLARASQPVDPVLDLTLELYVVGWSHQRERMAGAAFEIDRSGTLTGSHGDTWRGNPPDSGQVLGIVQALLDMDVDDGLVLVEESLGVTEIREDAKYDGLRVTLRARLGTANCMVQWDIGFGDAVTPGPHESELPTLLDDMPAPRLRVYPRETVFAEKVEALTVLGMINSRMKDYFDLLGLAREGRLEPEPLGQAIHATFARRGTPLPGHLPMGLSDAFALDRGKQAQWQAFLSRNRLTAPSLEVVVAEVAAFAMPALDAARAFRT